MALHAASVRLCRTPLNVTRPVCPVARIRSLNRLIRLRVRRHRRRRSWVVAPMAGRGSKPSVGGAMNDSPKRRKQMSAIKAIIQHQAALAQIDEMHRQAAMRRRVYVPAERRRRHGSRRSLAIRMRTLRPVLRGERA
jgi:hypothetical protein